MSVSSWKSPVSGNFDDPAKWSGGVPDLPSSEADLLAAGKPYTVTAGGLLAMGELMIGADATLAIAPESVFVVSPPNGAAAGLSNLGAIDVGAGSQIIVGDPMGESTVFNEGSISIDGPGSQFEVNAPVFDLAGGGAVKLRDGAAILAFYGPDTLDNQSNTISGSGSVGDGASLTLVNGAQGAIDANRAATLTLDTGANEIENAGLIETKGAGGLVIESDLQQDGDLIAAGTGALTIRNADVSGDGAITVERGGSLVLDGGGLTYGGTITIEAGGVLRPTAYRSGELEADDVENDGTIRIVPGAALILAGIVSGSGRILATSNSFEEGRLEIAGGGASLSGSRLILSDSIYNTMVADGPDGEQFTNAGAISGAGGIGDGFLRLFNTAAGLIDANDSDGLSVYSDDLAVAAGSETVNDNAGLMETTGAGGLAIHGTLDNSGILSADGAGALTLDGALIEAGGGIVSAGEGGSIVLDGGAVIADQSELWISAGGALTTSSGDAGDTIATRVINHGTLGVAEDSSLAVSGDWRNAGLMRLAGEDAAFIIEAGSVWRLRGDGIIALKGSSRIVAGGAGAVLENWRNILAGSGQIGDSTMTIDNGASGVIEARGGTLSLDGSALDNAGAILAAAGAKMVIGAAIANDGALIADSGGAIDAEAAVLGTGVALINGSGSLEFGGAVDNNVWFAGKALGELIVDNSTPAGEGASFLGAISGFAAGDAIDLRDLAFHSGEMSDSPSVFGSLDASLIVSNGSALSAAFHLLGAYSGDEFHFAGDGHGGTTITLVKAG